MYIHDFFQNFLKTFLVWLHGDFTSSVIAPDMSPTVTGCRWEGRVIRGERREVRRRIRNPCPPGGLPRCWVYRRPWVSKLTVDPHPLADRDIFCLCFFLPPSPFSLLSPFTLPPPSAPWRFYPSSSPSSAPWRAAGGGEAGRAGRRRRGAAGRLRRRREAWRAGAAGRRGGAAGRRGAAG